MGIAVDISRLAWSSPPGFGRIYDSIMEWINSL